MYAPTDARRCTDTGLPSTDHMSYPSGMAVTPGAIVGPRMYEYYFQGGIQMLCRRDGIISREAAAGAGRNYSRMINITTYGPQCRRPAETTDSPGPQSDCRRLR